MTDPNDRLPTDDRAIVRDLVAWFERSARDLPWRGKVRDPYASLVSEVMLQQTQVSRVVPAFAAFLARFPTPAALAQAPEQDVLAAWTGLGYYRRARLLHAAARAIVRDHQGRVPEDPAALRALPGVGRYTAGAIASIVFGRPEPIVDGNVGRVLLRVHGKHASVEDASAWLWDRAATLAGIAGELGCVGPFNEALMELGATVCVPEGPRCASCPWRAVCRSAADATQDQIPTPKRAARVRAVTFLAILVQDRAGRALLQQRPADGLWGGLWQLPTIEVGGAASPAAISSARRRLAQELGLDAVGPKLHDFVFRTTHRAVRHVVWQGTPRSGANLPPALRWCAPEAWPTLGMSSPTRRILGIRSTEEEASPKEGPKVMRRKKSR